MRYEIEMKFSVAALYGWYRRALRHPVYGWLVVTGTLVYLLSPFDIVPDLFPIIGQIDDAAILTLLVSELFQMAMDFLQSRSRPQVKTEGKGETTAPSPQETIDVDAMSVD